MSYDMGTPWNSNVKGDQVLPLINADDQCIRVEAGPGTGKTFGLKQRVLRLLLPSGRGVPHNSILVVAFNRVIATDLRESIGARLKDSDYQGQLPRIQTLHSFCLDQLGLQTRVLLPHEQDAMAYDLVTACPQLSAKYPNHSKLLKGLKLVQAGLSDDALLMDQAKKWLIRHKADHIGDVPSLLLTAMKGGDYGSLRFDHVIVDEFQDLTQTEQELVFFLAKSNGSVVALGDPRQSIYRFRGNDREGLSKLSSLSTRPVTDYPMSECQRCPNRFVDLANSVAVSSSATLLAYGNPGADNTHLVFWPTPRAEAQGMAKAVLVNLQKCQGQAHLAMVTRRKFGSMLRDELLALDPALRIRMVFSESPLDTWPVREAFIAFCLLCDPDGPTYRAWLAYRTRVGGVDYLASRRNSVAYLDLLGKVNDNVTHDVMSRLAAGTLEISGPGANIVRGRAIRALQITEEFSSLKDKPAELIDAIFDPERWLPWAPDDEETVKTDFALMAGLAHELLEDQAGGSTEQLLRQVTRGLRLHIASRDTDSGPETEPDLTIATLWSAKGVTAEHVYVLGLCREAIPGTKRDEYPGTDAEYYEEQQRLFYVTVTRSKGTLVLSRALKVKRGEAPGLGLQVDGNGHYPELKISPFLQSLLPKLPAAIAGESWQGC